MADEDKAAGTQGSGASARDHSVAAGAGGVAVGRDVYGPVVVAGQGAQVTVTVRGENLRDRELAYLDGLLARYEYWRDHYTPLAGIAEVRAAVQDGPRLDLPMPFIPPGFEMLNGKSGPSEGVESMEVYLVRHGEAVSKSVDRTRPLSGQGRKEVEQVAALVARMGLVVGQIRHSGKARAAQTAAILGEALSPAGGVVAVPGLGPDDEVQPVAEALAGESAPVMLVGHLPFLARLAGLLLTGDAESEVVRFRTGGMVCLACDEDRWQVAWILTPEMAGVP